jgi:hypothetical protein
MSVRASRTQLATLTQALMNHWEQAKNHWQDNPSETFAAKFLEPLRVQVAATLTAIDKLDQLIAKVRSDCE